MTSSQRDPPSHSVFLMSDHRPLSTIKNFLACPPGCHPLEPNTTDNQKDWEVLHCGDNMQSLWGMALCGDLLFMPYPHLPMGMLDNMAAYWEKFCNKIGGIQAPLPCIYQYISDFRLDCMALSCCFPLDSGLWQLDIQHASIPLLLIQYSQQPIEVY
ncbi:hypothetical protein DSO57_1035482 [Entomophthora muscae]|uniref:Uncharacterized protein n=1 Tax=Entomophthora muscae TaxID=34485 RepID=A0ACC2SD07_9FUNG|nr:hypothetical protein DSO57_1035482 [Entomophthora muscae]